MSNNGRSTRGSDAVPNHLMDLDMAEHHRHVALINQLAHETDGRDQEIKRLRSYRARQLMTEVWERLHLLGRVLGVESVGDTKYLGTGDGNGSRPSELLPRPDLRPNRESDLVR